MLTPILHTRGAATILTVFDMAHLSLILTIPLIHSGLNDTIVCDTRHETREAGLVSRVSCLSYGHS